MLFTSTAFSLLSKTLKCCTQKRRLSLLLIQLCLTITFLNPTSSHGGISEYRQLFKSYGLKESCQYVFSTVKIRALYSVIVNPNASPEKIKKRIDKLSPMARAILLLHLTDQSPKSKKIKPRFSIAWVSYILRSTPANNSKIFASVARTATHFITDLAEPSGVVGFSEILLGKNKGNPQLDQTFDELMGKPQSRDHLSLDADTRKRAIEAIGDIFKEAQTLQRVQITLLYSLLLKIFRGDRYTSSDLLTMRLAAAKAMGHLIENAERLSMSKQIESSEDREYIRDHRAMGMRQLSRIIKELEEPEELRTASKAILSKLDEGN